MTKMCIEEGMTPYFETKLGKLYHGNAVDIMPHLPQVDLTVTSPPYDNLREYEGYDFDFEKMAHGMKGITKDCGVVVWVVGDATVNGSETGTSFKQALYFKDIGFNLHDTMFYKKNTASFPPSNRYEQVVEYMFILSNGKPKTINLIKDKKNRWGGTKSFGARSNRQQDGSLKCKEVGVTQPFGIRLNIWEYSTGANYSTKDKIAFKHPAIFPEQLAQDHIISWSNEGDTVLDPMCGSGTVPKMAERLNRKWLACEISEKYCEIIAKRVDAEARQLKLFA